MRIQAKFLGEFRNVSVRDDLWEMWELLHSEGDPVQVLRDELAAFTGPTTWTAGEAARQLILADVGAVILAYKGRNWDRSKAAFVYATK